MGTRTLGKSYTELKRHGFPGIDGLNVMHAMHGGLGMGVDFGWKLNGARVHENLARAMIDSSAREWWLGRQPGKQIAQAHDSCRLKAVGTATATREKKEVDIEAPTFLDALLKALDQGHW